MTLKQLLDVIYCWDGEIIIRDIDMMPLAKFDYKWDSVLVLDERASVGSPSLYLDWTVVGFTPCLDKDGKMMYLEIIVKEY